MYQCIWKSFGSPFSHYMAVRRQACILTLCRIVDVDGSHRVSISLFCCDSAVTLFFLLSGRVWTGGQDHVWRFVPTASIILFDELFRFAEKVAGDIQLTCMVWLGWSSVLLNDSSTCLNTATNNVGLLAKCLHVLKYIYACYNDELFGYIDYGCVWYWIMWYVISDVCFTNTLGIWGELEKMVKGLEWTGTALRFGGAYRNYNNRCAMIL